MIFDLTIKKHIMTTSNGTIVAFHIGRGGRFHNQGHLSYCGEHEIGDFTGDLFIDFENAFAVRKSISGKENLEAKYDDALMFDLTAIAFFQKIGLDLGELVYTDGGGKNVGLTEAGALTGIGRIDEDGAYDTTYTVYLEDIDENEARAILNEATPASYEAIKAAEEVLENLEKAGKIFRG